MKNKERAQIEAHYQKEIESVKGEITTHKFASTSTEF